MRRSNSPSATAYYYCESHQYVADSTCTKDRISEVGLIQNVLSVIHKQIEVMLDMAQLFDRVKKQSHNDITTLTEQIRQLQTVLAKLKASKVKVYERYKDGTLDRDSYASQKADIGKEIAETDAQIAELETALQSRYQENGQPISIIESFKRYEKFTELSREMVDELIDSIYIYGSEAIEIVWNHMDEYRNLVQFVEKECEKIR
jgi:chromosome segregation ATPase